MLYTRPTKLLTPLLFSLLSACSITPEKSIDDLISDAVRNQTIEEGSEAGAKETPEYYIKLASVSTGETQQKYLIKAAELLYQSGDIASAQAQLESIRSDEAADSRHIQIQLLAAKIALANHNPAQAIDLLPKQKRMTTDQFIEVGEVRADASIAMGYYTAAIQSRVSIDPYYQSNDQRAVNHTAIWSALNSLPTTVLKELKSKDSSLLGWFELARIIRSAQISNKELENKILDWGTTFPHHPVSNTFITQLLDSLQQPLTSENNIAVLLPLQGPYKVVADAIRSGFLSAYYADTNQYNKPRIRFYDTATKDTDFITLYETAVSDGADYIVGPFDKTMINQLMQLQQAGSTLQVPVLTLNYAEDGSVKVNNLYQFGLLPEDEARQVAELAIRQNRNTAAILVPDTPWGQRLKDAFQQRYAELGGSILSTQFFDEKSGDYSQPIKQLLNLQYSNQRHKDLEHQLGVELKFSPYRRQDIDMIFLAATHRSARSIMPAFKFHHAGDLPVYSTSHVYTGIEDRSADLDLNGLTFCDLPWTLIGDNKLNQSFNKNWPEQQNYTRLFALGIDSYHLLYNLQPLSRYNYARFAGQTGNIYMDENNRLHRDLLWAKFRKGIAQYIDTTIMRIIPEPIEQDES
ncbi:MAG: penicillin-binding protein activator [Gammaproteobacteria bacterium]|nr:penicillin-binding protein activator [Gammaproteobacteria bacterium]